MLPRKPCMYKHDDYSSLLLAPFMQASIVLKRICDCIVIQKKYDVTVR